VLTLSVISAKKYQNPFTSVKVIASRWWDVFHCLWKTQTANVYL